MSDEALLLDAREAFKTCADAEADNRQAMLDDLRFARLSDQWPEEIRKKREKEGRPCLTINLLTKFVRQVTNEARQNKPQIKVRPVDDNSDPETAEIINGLIRNIEYTSNADVAYDTAAEFAASMGVGYVRVNIDYAHNDTVDKDLKIERVSNPFSVYGDPYSTAADSSDWNVCFVVDNIEKAQFERQYKGAEPVDWQDLGYTDLEAPWWNDDRVMVAEWWTREEVTRPIVVVQGPVIGRMVMDAAKYAEMKEVFDQAGVVVVGERDVKSYKVRQRLMTGAELLEDNEWAGCYIPIVPFYGDEVNVEGERHFRSLIRDSKDAQRNFNYWRTAATELVALAPKAPFVGEEGAFDVDPNWRTANTDTHAYLEYKQGAQMPQRQPFTGMPAAELQMALTASDDMKAIMGLYDASLGARSNETSGRAIMARQREGDVATFHFIDNVTRGIRHLGRILLDLIPAVYDGERVIRTLGVEGQPANVPLKRPFKGPDGLPRIYDLTKGKYDLAVESGPSYTTRREEASAQLIELVRAQPELAKVLGDLVIKYLDLPDADEIARRLKATQGQSPEVQKLKQQLQQAEAKLALLQAKTGIETQKLQIDAYEAETDRLQTMGGVMTPEAVQALVVQTLQQVLQSPDPTPRPMMPPGPPPGPPMPRPAMGQQQPPPGGFSMPGGPQ